jgi:hypothetical protein
MADLIVPDSLTPAYPQTHSKENSDFTSQVDGLVDCDVANQLFQCSCCKELKIRSDFGKNKAKKHGVDNQCRKCTSFRKAKNYRCKKTTKLSRCRAPNSKVLTIFNRSIDRIYTEADVDQRDSSLKSLVRKLVLGGGDA